MRWVRLALVVVGGGVLGLGAAMGTIVLGAGVFWLYVFGDDPWPEWSDGALVSAGFVVGLAVWGGVVFLLGGWRRPRA